MSLQISMWTHTSKVDKAGITILSSWMKKPVSSSCQVLYGY